MNLGGASFFIAWIKLRFNTPSCIICEIWTLAHISLVPKGKALPYDVPP